MSGFLEKGDAIMVKIYKSNPKSRGYVGHHALAHSALVFCHQIHPPDASGCAKCFWKHDSSSAVAFKVLTAPNGIFASPGCDKMSKFPVGVDVETTAETTGYLNHSKMHDQL